LKGGEDARTKTHGKRKRTKERYGGGGGGGSSSTLAKGEAPVVKQEKGGLAEVTNIECKYRTIPRKR